MRRILLATGVLALSTPVPALAGGACHQLTTEGSTATVHTEHVCFTPVVNRVAVGTTVTWLAEGDLKHNVTGSESVIGFHALEPGTPVRIRFDKAGTYPYSCTLHPGMTGVVVVGDGKTDASPGAPAVAISSDPVSDTVAIDTGGTRWTDNTAAVGGAGAGVLGLGVAAGFLAGRRRPE